MSRAIVRLMVLVIILTHGWSSMANVASDSHDPLQWSGHNYPQLLASLSAGHEHVIGHMKSHHGHDHEVDPGDQKHASDRHGHHGADHSHDSPNLPQVSVQVSVTASDLWLASYRSSDPPLRYFRLERPPKHQPS